MLLFSDSGMDLCSIPDSATSLMAKPIPENRFVIISHQRFDVNIKMIIEKAFIKSASIKLFLVPILSIINIPGIWAIALNIP